MQDAALDALQREAAILARYLSGREAPAQAIGRYAHAVGQRLNGQPARDPISVRAFGSPWSLPFLDAAAAWFARDGELRQRVLVMAAILEADTECCDLFVPQVVSRIRIMVTATGWFAVGAFKTLVGVPLFLAWRGSGEA